MKIVRFLEQKCLTRWFVYANIALLVKNNHIARQNADDAAIAGHYLTAWIKGEF